MIQIIVFYKTFNQKDYSFTWNQIERYDTTTNLKMLHITYARDSSNVTGFPRALHKIISIVQSAELGTIGKLTAGKRALSWPPWKTVQKWRIPRGPLAIKMAASFTFPLPSLRFGKKSNLLMLRSPSTARRSGHRLLSRKKAHHQLIHACYLLFDSHEAST